MEIALRTVVVLFVALAVGAAIIGFSINMINQSKDNMNQFNPDDNKDKLIELSTVTTDSLIKLGEQCYADYQQSVDVETLCYMAHGETGTVDNVQIESDLNTTFEPYGAETEDLVISQGQKQTIYIYYHLEKGVVYSS